MCTTIKLKILEVNILSNFRDGIFIIVGNEYSELTSNRGQGYLYLILCLYTLEAGASKYAPSS